MFDDKYTVKKYKTFYTENFFCPLCKDINSKCTLFNDKHCSQHFFDCWSFMHVIGGILLGLVVTKIEYAIIICILFEILENCLPGVLLWKYLGFSKLLEAYDTYSNIIGDTISVLLGFYIAKLGFTSAINFILSFIFIIIFFMMWLKDCSITQQFTRCFIKFKLMY